MANLCETVMISLDEPWLKRGEPICDVVKRVSALGSV